MTKKIIDSSLLDRAITFAVKAHANTERNSKGFPYIVHPMEAMAIVATMTSDQELLAAAALHDTVEDTDTTLEQLTEEFGPRVAHLVATESDMVIEGPEEDTWYQRKLTTINRLSAATREEQIVALGDKLSNMRAIARDYIKLGDDLWQRFHVKEKAPHAWHYQGLAKALSPLADTVAYQEFSYLVNKVFGE